MNFQKGHPEPLIAPLRINRIAGTKSMLVNPRDGKPNGIPQPHAIGSEDHKEELNRVIEARMDVERGIWPTKYFEFAGIDPEPAGFLKMAGITTADPKSAADFVRMDSPDELFNAIIRWADSMDIPLKRQQPNCIDFLGRYIHPFTYFANLVSERMELAFEGKYNYLMPRPEELVCENLPHYPCPTHPEAVAGHGTFAGCAYKAFIDTHNADSFEDEDVKNGTLMLAHLRDIAGMHFRQSSRNGWELGACNIGPRTKVTLPEYITRWS